MNNIVHFYLIKYNAHDFLFYQLSTTPITSLNSINLNFK